MSGYVAGTGIILGQGGGGNTSVTIDIDVEQINKNKTDITTIKADIDNLTTLQITEGGNLYYTEARVSANTDVVDLKQKVDGYTDGNGDDIEGTISKISTIAGLLSTNITNVTSHKNDFYGYTDNSSVYHLGTLDYIYGYGFEEGNELEPALQVKGVTQLLADLQAKDNDQDTTALITMVAQAVFEVGKYAYAKTQKGGLFGNKLSQLTAADNTAAYNSFSGDAIAEIIEELNNLVDVYRYDAINNEAGINTDPETGCKLVVGGKTRIKGLFEILDTGTACDIIE